MAESRQLEEARRTLQQVQQETARVSEALKQTNADNVSLQQQIDSCVPEKRQEVDFNARILKANEELASLERDNKKLKDEVER